MLKTRSFIAWAGLLALGLGLIHPVKTQAGGGVVVGDGTPTQNEPQTMMDAVPVSAEMDQLIENLAPTFFDLSDRLRYIHQRAKAGVIPLVRIGKTSDQQFAGFEAEVIEGGGRSLNIRNVSLYFWDNYFQLATSDPAHPSRMTQLKSLLHEYLHVMVAFPEFKTQRLTELVYLAAIGQASEAQLDQIEREIADTPHYLLGQCDGGCVASSVERFFEGQKATEIAGVPIIVPSELWIRAYEAATPRWKEKILRSRTWLWLSNMDMDQVRFFALAQFVGSDPEERARRYMQVIRAAQKPFKEKCLAQKITPEQVFAARPAVSGLKIYMKGSKTPLGKYDVSVESIFFGKNYSVESPIVAIPCAIGMGRADIERLGRLIETSRRLPPSEPALLADFSLPVNDAAYVLRSSLERAFPGSDFISASFAWISVRIDLSSPFRIEFKGAGWKTLAAAEIRDYLKQKGTVSGESLGPVGVVVYKQDQAFENAYLQSIGVDPRAIEKSTALRIGSASEPAEIQLGKAHFSIPGSKVNVADIQYLTVFEGQWISPDQAQVQFQ